MTSAPPRSVSTTGPAWLTWIGIVLLVAAVAIAIFTVSLFVSLLPVGVMNADGSPGEDVVASVDAGRTGEAEFEADTDYLVILVRPTDASEGALAGDIIVTAPDGSSSPAVQDPGVDMNVGGGGSSGESFTAFGADAGGTYEIAVPAATDAEPTSVLIVEDRETLSFVGGIFGTVGGVFAAILLGLVGLGLMIGGGLWWRSRRAARRAASPAT
jgi:hypothetical protein